MNTRRLVPLSKNEIQGKAIARKRAKQLKRDRSRAGMSLGSGNGLGASRKYKFEELEPRQRNVRELIR